MGNDSLAKNSGSGERNFFTSPMNELTDSVGPLRNPQSMMDCSRDESGMN
jgi:hypothetical protein